MSHVPQKGPLGYFLSKCLFFHFLNVHYFKISLWKLLNVVYIQQHYSQQMWCRMFTYTTIFTYVILYMNIIFIAQWLFGGNSEILHCCDVFANSQKLFKPESIFKQTCQLFLPRKYEVISQLRHNYAKGPFCMTRLCFVFIKRGWLVVLRIYVALAVFQPYHDLEAGDNQSLKIQVERPGIEPWSSLFASQELNHSATAAPSSNLADMFIIMREWTLLN